MKPTLDRVRGERALPDPASPPGRHVVMAPAALDMSGDPLRAGDSIVAMSGSSWELRRDGAPIAAGQLAECEEVGLLDRGALERIGAEVARALEGQNLWTALMSISPFVVPTETLLEPDGLDKALDKDLRHLREVFRRPATRLHAVIEPELVGRVKRVDARAPEYLASHPEDWFRRRVDGVVPRRVLGRHFELDVDTYENRVAARLVDRLRMLLVMRISALDQLLEMLEQLMNMSDRLQGGHHVRLRLAELWGAEFDPDLHARAGDRRSGMLATLRILGQLRDSRLYRDVARRSIPAQLAQTNVLSAHQRYRRVAEMWRAAHPEPASRSARFRQAQAVSVAYDRFALTLVARALRNFGFEPVSGERAGADGVRFELEGARGSVHLSYLRKTGIVVRFGDEALRFVPLAVSLPGSAERQPDAGGEHAWRRLAALLAAAGEATPAGTATVLLHLGHRKDRDELQRCAPDSHHADAGLAGREACAVPATPSDLLSLERVERVIRRRWFAAKTRSLPPRVTSTKADLKTLPAMSALRQEGADIVVLGSLEPDDHAELVTWAETRARDLKKTGAHAAVANARMLPDRIASAAHVWDQLRACPVCPSNGSYRLLESRRFTIDCPDCQSMWGVWSCGKCGDSVPIMRAGKDAIEVLDGDDLDVHLGRDAFALAGDTGFRCPRCGAETS